MNANNTSTSISKDMIITNLTGYISITDVSMWFDKNAMYLLAKAKNSNY